MGLSVGPGDASRRCKRTATVVVCAGAHVVATVLVLIVVLGPSGSSPTPLPEHWRRWNAFPWQGRNPTTLQSASRKAAMEYLRQSAPLTLIRRVNDIQAEAAKVVESTSEPEEVREQEEIGTGQEGGPAVEDDEVGAMERAIPPDKCYPERNTDLGGAAVRWGLSFHVSAAADCCSACSRHHAAAQPGQPWCNVWVFCPESAGCPSPDGYEHKFGECWLKHADRPQAFVNDYSLLQRDKSVTPLPVLWISGVIPFNGG